MQGERHSLKAVGQPCGQFNVSPKLDASPRPGSFSACLAHAPRSSVPFLAAPSPSTLPQAVTSVTCSRVLLLLPSPNSPSRMLPLKSFPPPSPCWDTPLSGSPGHPLLKELDTCRAPLSPSPPTPQLLLGAWDNGTPPSGCWLDGMNWAGTSYPNPLCPGSPAVPAQRPR